MTDLKAAITAKLRSLTDEQLNAVLFDVNAIANGVESCNERLYQLAQANAELEARAKNLQDRNSILDYRLRQLESENFQLKQEIHQLKYPKHPIYKGYQP